MGSRVVAKTLERTMKRLFAVAVVLLLPALAQAQYNSYTVYAAGTAPSYSGLWWNSAESGWGVSISHEADILFAVWYTYDRDGSPMWLVMPGLALVDDTDTMMGMMEMDPMMGMNRMPPIYTGTLYRSTGPAFSSATFDRNAVGVTEVGMATLMFTGSSTGVFAYTIGNFSAAKDISRMAFAPGMPTCTIGGVAKASSGVNYQDLWWRPAESGWGVNLAHQGNTIFATWYTYDSSGMAVWMIMSNATKTGDGTYAGAVFRATGPSFDSAAWDARRVSLTQVGSATLAFTDAANGTFAYTVGGVTQSKAITRMVYALPASVCN
jgi:hypothetical protein